MTNDQRIILVASLAEAATGLGLLAAPSIIIGLLLGEAPEGVAIVLSRVAGIVLVALAIACWPDARARGSATPYAGMLFYNVLIALVLAKVALDGEGSGPLSWPVVILHLVLVLLAWAWTQSRATRAR